MNPFWVTAFADYPASTFVAAAAHLRRLTGWELSAGRGEDQEFASLLPPDGDDFLGVQRLGDGPSRIHLDFHVRDPRAGAAQAQRSGATLLVDKDYQVLRSPGGLLFCFVDHADSRRPATSRWPDGHAAILDQVCLDIGSDRWDSEIAFWSAVTGWRPRRVGGEFTRLDQPALPVKLLLQRRDDSAGPTRAHLDWATDDRQAEIDRHIETGSKLVRRYPRWTVMNGPSGTYCITGRRPD